MELTIAFHHILLMRKNNGDNTGVDLMRYFFIDSRNGTQNFGVLLSKWISEPRELGRTFSKGIVCADFHVALAATLQLWRQVAVIWKPTKTKMGIFKNKREGETVTTQEAWGSPNNGPPSPGGGGGVKE